MRPPWWERVHARVRRAPDVGMNVGMNEGIDEGIDVGIHVGIGQQQHAVVPPLPDATLSLNAFN